MMLGHRDQRPSRPGIRSLQRERFEQQVDSAGARDRISRPAWARRQLRAVNSPRGQPRGRAEARCHRLTTSSGQGRVRTPPTSGVEHSSGEQYNADARELAPVSRAAFRPAVHTDVRRRAWWRGSPGSAADPRQRRHDSHSPHFAVDGIHGNSLDKMRPAARRHPQVADDARPQDPGGPGEAVISRPARWRSSRGPGPELPSPTWQASTLRCRWHRGSASGAAGSRGIGAIAPWRTLCSSRGSDGSPARASRLKLLLGADPHVRSR